MYWLLNPRVWVAAVLLVVLGATHFTAYRAGKGAVRAAWEQEKAATTAQLLEQERSFRRKEQALVAERKKLEDRYAQEKRKAADAAAGAQSALGGLRDALASAPSCPAGADPTAAGRTAGAARLESELLGHCAQTLVDLAAEADRLEARVVGLQQYVTQVCLKPH